VLNDGNEPGTNLPPPEGPAARAAALRGGLPARPARPRKRRGPSAEDPTAERWTESDPVLRALVRLVMLELGPRLQRFESEIRRGLASVALQTRQARSTYRE
jgi:hypothetical protein